MKSAIRVLLAVGGIASLLLVLPSIPAYAQTDISPEALQQMQELLEEKESRTAVQRKLGSQLVYALKASTGQPLTASISVLPGAGDSLNVDAAGVLVDTRASVSSELLAAISQAGGRVIYASAGTQRVRARIPLAAMEMVAARGDVQFIRPGAVARTHGMGRQHPPRLPGLLPSLAMRRWSANTAIFNLANRLGLTFFVGSLTTQGVISHSSNAARSTYGISGAGVRVGVLSDSAESTAFLIGTGDLPAGTTIVQDIIGGPGSSEGTAMMEIVYDMAPGVQLFFAVEPTP